MIEVDDVVLHELDAFQQVAHDARVIGDRDAQGILNRPHRRDRVDRSTDATHALGKEPGISGITPFEKGSPARNDDLPAALDRGNQAVGRPGDLTKRGNT